MDLERLKELCDRATPGPWRDNLPEIDSDWGTIGEIFSSADRNFICEARDAMPKLIERISKLEAALRWYADRNNYVVQITLDEKLKPIRSFNPMSDGGQRARDALGILK